MEVTRSNFQSVLEELDDVLEKASFLAIDGEFTGLNSGPEAKIFDTPAQYYNKVRSGSMDFLLVQFGLSVFTYDKETNKYSQRTYNFYVFPRQANKAIPDSRFMCQVSSIVFLADQGFDFNKLFNHGIPYLTTTMEEKLIKRMEDQQRIREDGLNMIPISDDDKPQINEICAQIDEFLKSDEQELLIQRCNSYIRRLVHQEARMRWPNKIRLESKTDGALQGLVASKVGTKEEEETKELKRKEKEQMELKEAVGLTTLLRKIADSEKLIVGHNMMLDLCHLIHQFFGPLPESYSEFKNLIHGLFPKLIDTKIIAQSPQLLELIPSSILCHIFENISKEPFSVPEIIPIENRSYTNTMETYHEAGYDAYITGLCFIAMTNYLGSLKPDIDLTSIQDSPLLAPFLNKLPMVRLKDYPHIDLVGNDPNPSRDHVFHITFPKEWKTSNITQLFTKYGGVLVSWLSDTTAYVALNRRDQASALGKTVKKNGIISNCRMMSYHNHQASLESAKTVNLEEDRKRKQPSPENSGIQKEAKLEGKQGDDDGWEFATGKKRRRRHGAAVDNGKIEAKPVVGEKRTFKENSWE